jgi:hypothetical protein
MDEVVPSGSVAENVTVTVWPTKAGFGETLLTLTIGGRSLIVSSVVAEPLEPLLSVTVIAIVNAWLPPDPVEA